MAIAGIKNRQKTCQDGKVFEGRLMFEKGLSHATGQGADLDYIEAHKCFNVAVILGCHEAKLYREDMALEMVPGEIASAQKAARQWFQIYSER